MDVRADKKTHHKSVDEAVDEDEHPDRRAHVAHTSPHTQHSACVVVCLQSCATLALCDNDESVQDLVELAEVEEPAPEGKSFVPQSSNIGRVRVSVRAHVDQRVLGFPDVYGRVVCSSIAQASRSVDLAHRVGNACKTRRVVESWESVSEGSVHGDESSGAIDCEHDVVEDDERLEEGLARDPPWLMAALAVDGIQGEDGEDVGGGKEEGYLGAHREVEEPWRDSEGRAKGAFLDWWWQSSRQTCRREGEQLLGRQREVDLRARHGAKEANALSMAVDGSMFSSKQQC